MSALVTADIHQTTNPRDQHRWDLWGWLIAEVRLRGVREVLILGDLTDEKDRHSSSLVNRMVEGLSYLSRECKVYILRGNHDAVDESLPFFGFVENLPNVRFMSVPNQIGLSIGECLFIPSIKTWDWEFNAPTSRALHLDYIFCHQTFAGAETENGTRLSGVPTSVFRGFKGRVYSGDIHVPQRLKGGVEYVGAPYRIDFGDEYDPRVLFIRDNGKTEDCHFPTKSKHLVVVRGPQSISMRTVFDAIVPIKKGDQVKFRVQLKRSELLNWREIVRKVQAEAKDNGWELFGVEAELLDAAPAVDNKKVVGRVQSPKSVLKAYAKSKKLSDGMMDLGLDLLQ